MIPEKPLDETLSDGISRRRVLKRIGSGVAIAWTAPILTSIRTPAFAQPYGCDCPPFNCQSPALCETGCFCAPHHGDGGPCVCFNGGTCDPQNPICNTDADCAVFGPGFVCADTDPNCLCAGNVVCVNTSPCPSGRQRQGPLKGITKR
ncbi:MAG: hypothetical protein ACRDHO_12320 [Actinomycetota bacterium]